MKFLLLISICFIGFGSFGQNPDAKVVESIGEQPANELLNSNLKKYNHLLDFIYNSWYVQDVSFKDLSSVEGFRKLEYIGSVPNKFDDGTNFHIEYFNPLLYNIKLKKKYPSTYKLGETGKIIVFYSQEYFLEKANKN